MKHLILFMKNQKKLKYVKEVLMVVVIFNLQDIVKKVLVKYLQNGSIKIRKIKKY